MKMILAIINNSDTAEVTKRMLAGSFSVTKIGSSGGLFRGGMTTIMSAVADGQVPAALEVLRSSCKSHRYPAKYLSPEGVYALPATSEGITVGGATVFVLNIEASHKF